MSTVRVSALIESYGAFSLLEDLVQATAIVDPLEIATQQLAMQASETIDRATMQAILLYGDPLTATSAVHVVKTSASMLISTNTFVANTYQDVLIAVSDIRTCVAELRRKRVPTVDGQNYIGILHPLISEDMRSDSTWQNWHRNIGAIIKRLIIKNFSKLREHPLIRTIRSQALNGRFNDYEEINFYQHFAWNPIG